MNKQTNLAEISDQFFNALAPGQLMLDLFNSIPGVYFFVKDVKGRFVACSDIFAKTLGQDAVSSVIGLTDYDFSPDFLADAFRIDDLKVMEQKGVIKDKIELVPMIDGTIDWICTNKMPMFNQNGEVIGLAGVARLIQDSDAMYAELPTMRDIVTYARSNYRDKISVADMAEAGRVSVSTQERLFKKVFALTPLMYLQKIRLNAACRLLRESNTDLAVIATECGFNDQTNMTRAFRLELKITPLKFRRRFTLEKGQRTTQRVTALQYVSHVGHTD